MAKVTIQVLDNGPYLVKGEVEVLDGLGKVLDKNEECYICRCGMSNNPPYCNGNHEGKFESAVHK